MLPLFLVGVLGANVVMVGLIEGIAEATAAIAKMFSGSISDWVGTRKLLVVIGYGLSAATKPIFPLAGSVTAILGARFLDRIGKGVRDAPRDGLIADITPPEIAGAAFGMRQALDTLGAVAGPLLAMALMTLTANDYRAVFWWGTIPAGISVAVLVLAVREPEAQKIAGQRKGWPIQRAALSRLGGPFWWVVIIGIVFTMARFSEAFLVLKGQEAGLPPALVPLVMVLMSLVYAVIATPAGILSDKIGRQKVLAAGLAALIAADLTLGFVPGLAGLFAGVALWGVYLGLSQSLLSALVADTAPFDLRGTAFGVFNFLTGAAFLAASSLAGLLWSRFGSSATFAAGAGFAAVAAVALAAGGARMGQPRAAAASSGKQGATGK